MPRGFLTRSERRAKYAKRPELKVPYARTRSRDLRSTITGTYTPPSGPVVVGSAQVGIEEECQDIVGAYNTVNPFSMYTEESSYPVLNGVRLNGLGVVIRRFTDFPIGFRPGPVDPRVAYPALLPTEISDFAWATLARTNPNSPHVGVPSFVGELKDFFSLIRGRGEHLIRQAAQGYIAWRWVLRPLWSDLQKMLSFQEAVNQRAQMLHNLQNGKEIRKRVKLRSGTIIGSTVTGTIHSQGAVFNGKYRVESSEEVWGTATWKIANSTRLPRVMRIKNSKEILDSKTQRGWHENEKFLNALAAGTAEWSRDGIISHDTLATAWQLCPWSWLIDWCSNYDDIIEASRNAIPVTWSKIAVMRRTQSKRVYFDLGTDATWSILIKNGNYFESATRKERFRPILLPFSLPCFLPLISEGHWQILAALAVTSGRLPRV